MFSAVLIAKYVFGAFFTALYHRQVGSEFDVEVPPWTGPDEVLSPPPEEKLVSAPLGLRFRTSLG